MKSLSEGLSSGSRGAGPQIHLESRSPSSGHWFCLGNTRAWLSHLTLETEKKQESAESQSPCLLHSKHNHRKNNLRFFPMGPNGFGPVLVLSPGPCPVTRSLSCHQVLAGGCRDSGEEGGSQLAQSPAGLSQPQE